MAKRIVVAVLTLLLLQAVPGVFSARASEGQVREGNALYDQEKYGEAAEKFAQARESDPDSDIVNYNLGAALYKEGKYKEAAEAFMRALATEDRSLEARAMYNLANSRYRMGSGMVQGDMKGAAGMYREALEYYKRAMELDQNDGDAKYNHELVERNLKLLLDQMKNQQQNQQDKQEKQDKGQDQNQEQQSGSDEPPDDQQEQNQQESDTQQRQPSDQKQEEGNHGQGGSSADDGEEQPAQEAGADDSKDTMSEEEARMLLDAYGREEARDQVRQKQRGRVRGVLKDW